MEHVLDSSAIALILKRLGGKSIEVLEESVTIGLAIYEAWEHPLERIRVKEAHRSRRSCEDLCRVICEMARSMRIVAADVCGFYIPDRIEESDLPRWIDNLSPLLETLGDAILKGMESM